MSYVKSLRFKLMLLCVVPLLSCAFVFIGHSVVIANQVRSKAAAEYVDTLINSGADPQTVSAAKNVSVSLGWVGVQWTIFFLIAFVCFYIPITLNIGKFIAPIRKLSKCSDSLAIGNLQIDVEKDRTDELGILQESFKNLIKASNKQADLLKQIADGDLTGNYSPRSESDVMGYSIIQMLERNNAAMSQILMSTNQLFQAAQQISDSSQNLASGASEQSAAVEELSASITEVAASAHHNVQLANKASDLGETIMDSAEKSNRQMEQMLTAVKSITDASNDIYKVIKVIEDIAFQTNILALNASVEAARAGEHGKGFAIVANEVRTLANRSAEAAKNSGALITNSIEKAQLGRQIANKTAESLTEIVQGIHESSKIISEIAQSNGTLDNAINQITKGMDQVAQVVQRNSATAEETAACSVEVNGQTENLQKMVSKFKLR